MLIVGHIYLLTSHLEVHIITLRCGLWSSCRTDSEEPVELIQVSWLEVTGSVDQLKPGKTYEVTFEVALTADAFGWKDIQVFLMAKVGKKGKYKWAKLKLNQDQSNVKVKIPDNNQKLSIDVPDGSSDNTLHFGLYEVWSGKWKGGLKIYNARVTAASTTAAWTCLRPAICLFYHIYVCLLLLKYFLLWILYVYGINHDLRWI